MLGIFEWITESNQSINKILPELNIEKVIELEKLFKEDYIKLVNEFFEEFGILYIFFLYKFFMTRQLIKEKDKLFEENKELTSIFGPVYKESRENLVENLNNQDIEKYINKVASMKGGANFISRMITYFINKFKNTSEPITSTLSVQKQENRKKRNSFRTILQTLQMNSKEGNQIFNNLLNNFSKKFNLKDNIHKKVLDKLNELIKKGLIFTDFDFFHSEIELTDKEFKSMFSYSKFLIFIETIYEFSNNKSYRDDLFKNFFSFEDINTIIKSRNSRFNNYNKTFKPTLSEKLLQELLQEDTLMPISPFYNGLKEYIDKIKNIHTDGKYKEYIKLNKRILKKFDEMFENKEKWLDDYSHLVIEKNKRIDRTNRLREIGKYGGEPLFNSSKSNTHKLKIRSKKHKLKTKVKTHKLNKRKSFLKNKRQKNRKSKKKYKSRKSQKNRKNSSRKKSMKAKK